MSRGVFRAHSIVYYALLCGKYFILDGIAYWICLHVDTWQSSSNATTIELENEWNMNCVLYHKQNIRYCTKPPVCTVHYFKIVFLMFIILVKWTSKRRICKREQYTFKQELDKLNAIMNEWMSEIWRRVIFFIPRIRFVCVSLSNYTFQEIEI